VKKTRQVNKIEHFGVSTKRRNALNSIFYRHLRSIRWIGVNANGSGARSVQAEIVRRTGAPAPFPSGAISSRRWKRFRGKGFPADDAEKHHQKPSASEEYFH
jgi:hypothetical protein